MFGRGCTNRWAVIKSNTSHVMSAAMSLSWRRAGPSRVDSRVCCRTPSRSRRTVWRYTLIAAVRCIVIVISINYVRWPALLCFVALDVEWVDVAARRPEFLQRPLLRRVLVFSTLLPLCGWDVKLHAARSTMWMEEIAAGIFTRLQI